MGSRGGGVCIYIKSVYSPTEIIEDFGLSNPLIETVWCSCSVNNEKILLGCIYRPGDASEEGNRQINRTLGQANNLVKKGDFSGVMITGDFNYWGIEWDSFGQGKLTNACYNYREFLENYEESGLIQNIYFKTFQDGDGNLTNTLDLFFTDL